MLLVLFKQRGYTDSSFDRRLATTTGEMLNQTTDLKQEYVTLSNSLSSTTSPVINRRHPDISNRISEHDNRNLIQNYGEYFGRGFGKRLVSQTPAYNHDWIFLNEPRPNHPDRGLTQHDYRGLPPLENPQSSSLNVTKNSKKSSDHWMTSCYDDFGRDIERVPSEFIYRHDYKRMPIHPWHY
ncbi:unnamed protein product [Rotaria sp. Silwood2]|nr:unnamed protein product [Rotaria sp. Silwood2]